MTDVVRVSAAEFDAFTASEERRYELINGEVIEMPTPPIIHQRLSGRLFRLVGDLKPDGEAFYAPIEVYLDEYNIPQPDIVWVANPMCEFF